MKKKIESMIENISTYEQIKAVITTLEMMMINEIIGSNTYKESYSYLQDWSLKHNMSDDYTSAYEEVLKEIY